LTRAKIEPTIYRTRGEHTNHYTTDKKGQATIYKTLQRKGFDLIDDWCLTPLSAIFQLYHGDQF
jgi:hypothetical protein